MACAVSTPEIKAAGAAANNRVSVNVLSIALLITLVSGAGLAWSHGALLVWSWGAGHIPTPILLTQSKKGQDDGY